MNDLLKLIKRPVIKEFIEVIDDEDLGTVMRAVFRHLENEDEVPDLENDKFLAYLAFITELDEITKEQK